MNGLRPSIRAAAAHRAVLLLPGPEAAAPQPRHQHLAVRAPAQRTGRAVQQGLRQQNKTRVRHQQQQQQQLLCAPQPSPPSPTLRSSRRCDRLHRRMVLHHQHNTEHASALLWPPSPIARINRAIQDVVVLGCGGLEA